MKKIGFNFTAIGCLIFLAFGQLLSQQIGSPAVTYWECSCNWGGKEDFIAQGYQGAVEESPNTVLFGLNFPDLRNGRPEEVGLVMIRKDSIFTSRAFPFSNQVSNPQLHYFGSIKKGFRKERDFLFIDIGTNRAQGRHRFKIGGELYYTFHLRSVPGSAHLPFIYSLILGEDARIVGFSFYEINSKFDCLLAEMDAHRKVLFR